MGRWEPVRLLHLHNVRLWQVASMPMALGDVRFRGLLGQVWQKRNSGKGLMRVPASQKWPWEAHGKQSQGHASPAKADISGMLERRQLTANNGRE